MPLFSKPIYQYYINERKRCQSINKALYQNILVLIKNSYIYTIINLKTKNSLISKAIIELNKEPSSISS